MKINAFLQEIRTAVWLPMGAIHSLELWGKRRSNDPSSGNTSHYNNGYLTNAVFLSDSQIVCGHTRKKKKTTKQHLECSIYWISKILPNECQHYTVVLLLLPLYGTLEHTGSQGQSQECMLNTFTFCLGDILCTGVCLRPIKCCVQNLSHSYPHTSFSCLHTFIWIVHNPLPVTPHNLPVGDSIA